MAKCPAAFVESFEFELKCVKSETVGYLYSADFINLQKSNQPPDSDQTEGLF